MASGASKADSTSTDGQEEPVTYEVQTILGKAKIEGVESYLVKWRGYSKKDATWEPLENLAGCEKLIANYEKREKNKQQPLNSTISKETVETPVKDESAKKKKKPTDQAKSVAKDPLKEIPEPAPGTSLPAFGTISKKKSKVAVNVNDQQGLKRKKSSTSTGNSQSSVAPAVESSTHHTPKPKKMKVDNKLKQSDVKVTQKTDKNSTAKPAVVAASAGATAHPQSTSKEPLNDQVVKKPRRPWKSLMQRKVAEEDLRNVGTFVDLDESIHQHKKTVRPEVPLEEVRTP